MSLIDYLIHVIVWGLIFYVLWWGLSKFGLPEPFGKVAQVILVVLAVIVLLGPLLGYSSPVHLTIPGR